MLYCYYLPCKPDSCAVSFVTVSVCNPLDAEYINSFYCLLITAAGTGS